MNRWKLAGLAGLALSTLMAGVLAAQQPSLVVPADKALLIIRVPTSDATMKIADYASGQRGLDRYLFTPALAPGSSYSYHIEVSWNEGGQAKKAVRQVSFKAGEASVVDFRVADSVEKIGKPVVVKKLPEGKSTSKDRHFVFTYGGKVKNLKPGQPARVWLPVAESGADQEITVLTQSLPGEARIYKEKQYGNAMFYFQATADKKGEIPFEVSYEVRRKEVKTDLAANLLLKPTPHDDFTRFLQADAKAPITGKPLELLKDTKVPSDQFAAAKVLYDVVNGHMKFSKEGKGWGQGDSVWACDSKFGNCSDFHALFISMARGNKIPSKFEMGFPIPTKHGEGAVGGYHCWAWFYPNQKGWVPVDISEANRNPELKDYYFGNLTEDRVRFTTGRDINLEPRQKGPPLNFFVYPYVEVNGKTHPQEKIDRKFAYQDVK